MDILSGLKEKYEEHHKVNYTGKQSRHVFTFQRYITDKYLPDKAIDILDEAGAKALHNLEVPKNILDIENKIQNIRGKGI